MKRAETERIATFCTLVVVIAASGLIASHSRQDAFIYDDTNNVVEIHLFGSTAEGWGLQEGDITSPGPTITVREGDLVNLTLTSADGVTHNFFVDYNRDANPSAGEPESPDFQTATVNYQLAAATPGTFTYYCQYHRGTMSGTFIVQIALATDINGDGEVDIFDVVTVASAFGTTPEDGRWNPDADLDDNGTIDIFDVARVAKDYGKNATSFVPHGSNIFGRVEDTDLKLTGEIIVRGIGTFTFEPHQIVTKRPDVFQPGHFSIFDVLAHLDEAEKVAVLYHFDEEMNTYVIDSINGEQNWWYEAYYDGGWLESNVFRMDHYPVKDGMYIRIFQTNPSRIDEIFASFRLQVSRGKQSERMLIPEVIIRGRGETLIFNNVTVGAYNLRNDIFKPGVITAVDVILSLADKGMISYDLRWYAEIAGSEVKDFYVERINEDTAFGRCGFVYECGEKRFGWDNHIHIPSDIRVINSPEYMEWFWICI